MGSCFDLSFTFMVVMLAISAQILSGVHLSKLALLRAAQSSEEGSQSRVRRQAITNPRPHIPLALLGKKALDVPIPTNIGHFPGVSKKVDKCDRDSIIMEDGTCQDILTDGNCGQEYIVLVDPKTEKGFCAPRLCPPDRVFVSFTQLCHDPADTDVCPPGRELYYSSYGTAVCTCPDGTIEGDTDLDDDVCEVILGESLKCLAGQENDSSEDESEDTSKNNSTQVFWFKDFNSPPQCLPDPCNGANLNRGPNELPFVPSSTGQCFQLGQSEGVCPNGTFYALKLDDLVGECSSLEDAGYNIFDAEELQRLKDKFGPIVSENTASPILTNGVSIAQGNVSQIGGGASELPQDFKTANIIPTSSHTDPSISQGNRTIGSGINNNQRVGSQSAISKQDQSRIGTVDTLTDHGVQSKPVHPASQNKFPSQIGQTQLVDQAAQLISGQGIAPNIPTRHVIKIGPTSTQTTHSTHTGNTQHSSNIQQSINNQLKPGINQFNVSNQAHQGLNQGGRLQISQTGMGQSHQNGTVPQSAQGSFNHQNIQRPFNQQSNQRPLTQQTIKRPTIQQSSQRPLNQQTIKRPTIQQSSQRPLNQQTIKRPTIQQSSQRPLTQQTIKRPTIQQSSQIPLNQQTIKRPTIQQSNQRPLNQQTIKRPTIQQSSQRPLNQQTIKRPTIQQSSQRPLNQQTIKRPTIQQSSQRPLNQQTIKRPTIQQSSQRPLTQQTIKRPTIQQSSQRPLNQQTIKRPTIQQSSQRPLHQQNIKSSISAQGNTNMQINNRPPITHPSTNNFVGQSNQSNNIQNSQVGHGNKSGKKICTFIQSNPNNFGQGQRSTAGKKVCTFVQSNGQGGFGQHSTELSEQGVVATFNSPELVLGGGPSAVNSFEPLNTRPLHSYGYRFGRSLGFKHHPEPGILTYHVTVLPNGDEITHLSPLSRHPRHLTDIQSKHFSMDSFVFEDSLSNKVLSRKKRALLPYASPSNVFETRLLGCRPGAARDINAKCRDTILPAQVPKRRGTRAAPPVPPTPRCPQGMAFSITRMCAAPTSAQNSLRAFNLG